IIPVVLYHDGTPWSPPLDFESLVDAPLPLRPALEPYLVRMTYLLDDLSHISDDQLRGRAMTALTKVLVVCFRDARRAPDFLGRLARWVDALREVFAAPNGFDALTRVATYILAVSKHVPQDDLAAFMKRNVSVEAEDTVMTAGERLIEQGIQQGIEQGERKLLLYQLRRRFGEDVNAATEQRIATASGEQLELWA